MAWVKIDDQFPDHWKLAELGDYAPLCGWLYICGLAYCNRQLTDGRIPKTHVKRLASFDHLSIEIGGNELMGMCDEITADGLAPLLVEAGLWEDAGTHYRVHDYLQYQPSRERVLAEREATKERVARWREGRNAVTNADGNGDGNDVSTPSPVPVPVPVPEPEPEPEEETRMVGSCGTDAPAPVAERQRRHRLPSEFTLTDARRGVARSKGLLAVEPEFEKFVDYHRAKGSTMLDWEAAWRTWVANAVGRFAPRGGPGATNGKVGHGAVVPTAEQTRAMLREKFG